MPIIRKIINLSKPYWPRLCAAIVLSLMVSGITATIAWVVKPALDIVFAERRYDYLKFLPAGIVLLFSVKGLFSFGQTYLMKSAGMKLVRETRNKLYNHILYLPLAYFNKESSGVIISRIMYDSEVLNGLMSKVIQTLVLQVPTIIFLLGLAFYRRWDLTLMALTLLPFIAYSTKKFGKKVKKKRKEGQRKLSFLTQKVGESILGARVIKVFNRESTRANSFNNENRRYYREILSVERTKEATKLVTDIATGAGVALIVWYGSSLVLKEIITAGDFASIIIAIYMIFPPTKKLGDAYNSLQEIRASIERIDTLLDTGYEEKGSVKISRFKESIRFENVSFAYPGNNSSVLNNVNLEIRHGEIIAIVGQSGVGKSTLVDLIPRFNKPSKGAITIDGINLNEVDLHSLRELIGIVSQDVLLFNDSVRENIAFGKDGAEESDIIKAAKLAYADEFIQELPDKYNTIIGEKGLMLSGGQRQRIAIARAILKNSPILILDEATSSLDSVSESIVRKALEKLMKGRTTIVIAHRLSTVRKADRIIVLDGGRIIETGTHKELLEYEGRYQKLYELQFREQEVQIR